MVGENSMDPKRKGLRRDHGHGLGRNRPAGGNYKGGGTQRRYRQRHGVLNDEPFIHDALYEQDRNRLSERALKLRNALNEIERRIYRITE